jgi:hypothetical protein
MAALKAKNQDANIQDPNFSPYYVAYRYFVRVANIVDFFAVVPSFFQLVVNSGSNSTVVRTLKIFRVFRILKLSRSNDTTVKVMFTALSASLQSLFVFGMCALIIVVLFGTVQFTLEDGTFMVTKDFPEGELAHNNFFFVVTICSKLS